MQHGAAPIRFPRVTEILSCKNDKGDRSGAIRLDKELGAGVYGKVFRATIVKDWHLTGSAAVGKVVALKIASNLDPVCIDALRSEEAIIKYLNDAQRRHR